MDKSAKACKPSKKINAVSEIGEALDRKVVLLIL